MKKVILGMSGGVDSSVAALLLKEQGYEVIGLFMKNWNELDPDGVCTATDDADDARRVAHQLGIPFYTINFEKEYWNTVFTYFLSEYKRGRTPNPDVMCNQEIKFNAFLNYAMTIEGDYIAMGHYARVNQKEGLLLRGSDTSKDQSYFLSRITSEALNKTIFPIGDLLKTEVRKIAEENDLVTAKKKDSTGICFIGERNFNEFLDKYLFTKPGDIIDVDSMEKVGDHFGIIHYTNGQRKGLGIGGIGSGEPWFVVGKNLEKNKVYVAQSEQHPANYSVALYADNIHWISGQKPVSKNLTAKFRYRQPDVEISMNLLSDDRALLEFEPFKGITPGQVAVLYDGEVCLGSMLIDEPVPLDSKYAFTNTISK